MAAVWEYAGASAQRVEQKNQVRSFIVWNFTMPGGVHLREAEVGKLARRLKTLSLLSLLAVSASGADLITLSNVA